MGLPNLKYPSDALSEEGGGHEERIFKKMKSVQFIIDVAVLALLLQASCVAEGPPAVAVANEVEPAVFFPGDEGKSRSRSKTQ